MVSMDAMEGDGKEEVELNVSAISLIVGFSSHFGSCYDSP